MVIPATDPGARDDDSAAAAAVVVLTLAMGAGEATGNGTSRPASTGAGVIADTNGAGVAVAGDGAGLVTPEEVGAITGAGVGGEVCMSSCGRGANFTPTKSRESDPADHAPLE